MDLEARNKSFKRGIILAVSLQWSWPYANGLTVRTIELLKQLCRHRDVILIAPASSDPNAAPEPYDLAARVIVASTGDGWVGVPSASTKQLVEAASEALDRYSPDAIVVWGDTPLVEQLKRVSKVPVIVDRVDCYTLGYWRDLLAVRKFGTAARVLRDLVGTAFKERSMARNADAVLLVGEKDAATVRMLAGHTRVEVIPNGAPNNSLRNKNDLSDNPSIIFSGVLEYPPNIDAASYFANDIFPIVRRKMPTATFVIAGRKPTAEILKLENIPGVIVKGDVPDMAQTLKSSWISVAPMRTGAGIKNKVLEAWSVGLPVVLSTVAANGLSLPTTARKVVFDTAPTFAEGVLSMLSDKSEVLALGALCWEHVRSHQSWEKIGDELSKLIEELTAG